MALFPVILTKYRHVSYNSKLALHERIHIRQQLELLIIPFYLFYFLNYLVNILYYRNHHKAYINIIFEREAYANDNSEVYLRKRPFWNFWRYL